MPIENHNDPPPPPGDQRKNGVDSGRLAVAAGWQRNSSGLVPVEAGEAVGSPPYRSCPAAESQLPCRIEAALPRNRSGTEAKPQPPRRRIAVMVSPLLLRIKCDRMLVVTKDTAVHSILFYFGTSPSYSNVCQPLWTHRAPHTSARATGRSAVNLVTQVHPCIHASQVRQAAGSDGGSGQAAQFQPIRMTALGQGFANASRGAARVPGPRKTSAAR